MKASGRNPLVRERDKPDRGTYASDQWAAETLLRTWGVPPRVERALRYAGYLSREAVASATDSELLAIRNFGPTALAQVRVLTPGVPEPTKTACVHCGGSGWVITQ